MTKLSSSAIITSIIATTTATLSSSFQELRGRKWGETGLEEKFAPRFDGLRFIETLVTAHK
ncbi:hypothetical protein HanRHA438_Chr02g0081301 [Helianthus annuus]|uniref:Uncharacterized protein n=1 Tax=Helianthus annuus TaxID=4232 RepID=A0A251VIJ1_HELAN|nr:hypothetical protein HanXRQr2_Chr02g0069811 [Helianthus annuus]KAJ0605002.1 hypothetical protein HanHA300_Chr02g0058071 [Helianthus annuus]KAJ0615683.1 hypothetical protein HanIR_Chr02g0081991 [Helianthus annuus]KAJ0619016.1 hypothetical protein HanHA89_Chr02g0066561 [Helianthus annuus]KAJ0777470.1 hypothetical protein HanLR1_Chr02g0060831 [Helianthus annuus]